jgi:ubiquinone/menaquinone biosynthesis C-methylase UbiE
MTMVDRDLEALAAIKGRTRATWGGGDYDSFVDDIWSAGAEVTRRADVRPGDRVLDIACGTGNAAIQAAQAGGTVVGLDLTPELFDAARRRASLSGVEVEFVEGDAEAIPYDDGSFDVVLSTFGVMFAPRHAVAAAEIVRVLRPGGRLGLANWDPEGTAGELFRAMGPHLPPPPPVAEPPLLWGTEAHVLELFADSMELEFDRAYIQRPSDLDVKTAVDRFVNDFPTMRTARALLEPQGLWEAAEADARPAIAQMLTEPTAYLLVSGTKSG